jgi:peptidoglycan/xylan/chitin deacetylase (PgdA/CDA1 family)
MRFLSRFRQVVPLRDALAGQRRRGRPAVAITFDDAYENVLANAVPLLEHYGFPASVFVPTRWIGGENTWDALTDCYPLDIMDEAALREADCRGLTVESHGHGHIDLERAPRSVVAEDLELSKASLARVLGRVPRYLAYPYGRQSADTRRAAEAAGFEDAFLFDQVGAGRFARERVSVDGHEGRARLRLKTAGGYLARRRSPLGAACASLVRRVVPSRVGS